MPDIRPYRIDVPSEVLDDLRERLTRTRSPEAECVDDWSQGMPLAYTRELAAHWADGYDWRSREAALNRFDQFITEIEEVDIHLCAPRDRRLLAVGGIGAGEQRGIATVCRRRFVRCVG